ncbi:hypothetical protein D3C73_1035730 [compost metagenome]
MPFFFNNGCTDRTDYPLDVLYLRDICAQLRKQRRKSALSHFPKIILLVLLGRIKDLFVHKSPHKALEIFGHKGNLIIRFLVHVDHCRFPVPATSPVIQHDHIMTCRRAVSEHYANIGITPLFNHEAAA